MPSRCRACTRTPEKDILARLSLFFVRDRSYTSQVFLPLPPLLNQFLPALENHHISIRYSLFHFLRQHGFSHSHIQDVWRRKGFYGRNRSTSCKLGHSIPSHRWKTSHAAYQQLHGVALPTTYVQYGLEVKVPLKLTMRIKISWRWW